MELIPGLPTDVARVCLVRIGYNQFSNLVSVCKDWKNEVVSKEFRKYRIQTGNSQRILVMTQARINPNPKSSLEKYRVNPVYRFTVLEPDTGHWYELPPIPEFSDGLPMFCQVVGVGSDLVVLGGLNPVTWEVSNNVFVYDFVSATWRRGTDMPGDRRLFFGCASDSDRTVYVVGGHDGDKNALRSVLAYDVVKDEWTPLPDMANERDECKAVFHCGKLHVIGGYRTESQGRFERSAEVFDVAASQWADVEEDYMPSASCPRTCVNADDKGVYMCSGDDVVALRGTAWQPVAKLPADVCNAAYMTGWKGKLLVIGSARFGEPHVAYTLDTRSNAWTKIETPEEFSGHVQSGCCLEM